MRVEKNSMKKINKHNQDGFTMVEIMVVVVIVAILAAVALPTYFALVQNAYASEPKTIISNIENAGKMYYQTYGEWPSDIEEMERRGLLEIDRSTKLKWQFELNMSLDGGTITAESTEEMKGGAGKIVVFDRSRGKFLGFGSKEEVE